VGLAGIEPIGVIVHPFHDYWQILGRLTIYGSRLCGFSAAFRFCVIAENFCSTYLAFFEQVESELKEVKYLRRASALRGAEQSWQDRRVQLACLTAWKRMYTSHSKPATSALCTGVYPPLVFGNTFPGLYSYLSAMRL
jgi:hypothetical protein